MAAGSAPSGTYTSYDLTTGVIVDIEPTIWLLDPTEVPLQGGGGADGRSALATGTVFEKKFEWQDETLLIPKSTLGASATTGDNFITVATGDRLKFASGDALVVQKTDGTVQERMRVTGYGSTADTLTVDRTFQSNTAGALTISGTNHAVLSLGPVLAEGADPYDARAIDRNNRSNYCEIFGPTAVQVSGTENVVKKYGLTGTEFDKQAANRTKELFIQMEQAILYSKKLEDTTNKLRTTGGIFDQISTNINTSVTSISESALLDAMQASYDLGGNIDRATMGSTQKRKVSALATGVTIQIGRGDNGRGQTVDYFECDFGRVSMLMNRWCKKPDMVLYARDQAEWLTLRPLQFEMLAKTGDSLKGQLVCEKGLKFRRERHAYAFTRLT